MVHMKLKEILNGISYQMLEGSPEVEISSLAWDSRKVEKGSLFICVKGKNVDRHDYAKSAIEAGAVALVVEHPMMPPAPKVPILLVENAKLAMTRLAQNFYHCPSQKLKLIGIVGNLGKTSTAWLLADLLRQIGVKVGIFDYMQGLSHPDFYFCKMHPHIPDAIQLNAALDDMQQSGVSHAVMEISPSAMEEHKYHGLCFDSLIVLNTSTDCQPFVKVADRCSPSFEQILASTQHCILDPKDPLGALLLDKIACGESKAKVSSFGDSPHADVCLLWANLHAQKTDFHLRIGESAFEHLSFPIPAKPFLWNLLAALACITQMGATPDAVIPCISRLPYIKGRFERIPNPKQHTVIVDCAFRPFAFESLLQSLRAITRGRLITVFGCGGDRENPTRPQIGAIAGRLSDFCVITSDNPRTEDPLSIIREIETGMQSTACAYAIEEDRRAAIYLALDMIQPEDVLVISGKGQENYQVFRNYIRHFSDQETVLAYYSNN